MSRRVSPLVVLFLLAVACHPGHQARPTPPPPWAGKPIDSIPLSQVLAYANTLQFDSTMPGADTITVQTPIGDTIRLEADPEIGAGAISDSDVAQGRIIGRVKSNARFTPLGAGPGITYYWVSGVGERAKGVMIPADSAYPRSTRPIIVRDHLPKNAVVADRFVVIEHDGVRILIDNGRCTGWCCSFASDFVARDSAQVDSALDAMHQKLGGS